MSAVDYGHLLRAGILVPSGNPIAEPEIRAMLPAGVSTLVTRLELCGSSEAELMRMIDGLEEGARLLAHANVAVIVFHCTAVSTFAPHLAPQIKARIEGATGLPAFATSDAIVAALAALGARRVSLLTPYLPAVHDREIAFLEHCGVAVCDEACLGIDTNEEMARLSPERIAAFARAHRSQAADACVLSCTALRSAGIIASLEAELGMPVITSNQAMAWFLLRSHGIGEAVPGFGRIFSVPLTATEEQEVGS